MPIEDLKVKPEILSPKPPSLASDEEFAAGTSTTSSPTVKQAKEKLVTTDTAQTITGVKVFTNEPRRKSKVIDITTQPEKYTANNGFKFVDKNDNIMGYLENAQKPDGEITTGIHARNKDGYQPRVSVCAPLSGTTGAYATAPNTPANAPANAIVTKDKIANMVTTDTAQTITGFKAFNSGSGNNRTNIDIITNDGVAEDANVKWAGSIQFKKGKLNVGYCEAMRDNINSSIAQIVAHNSVNGQDVYSNIRSIVKSDGTVYATAPNTPANPPNNAIITAGYVKNNYVTLNTNQTISGVKTFTGNTIVNGGAGNGTFTIKNNVTTYGTSAVDLVVATSNKKNQLLVHFQEGNKWCAYFDQDPSTKNITFSLTPCAAVYAPTPAVASNGGDVATTAWFNSKMQVVSALPANPDPNVFYFIPG